jgi:hypothetical protein
MLVKLTILGLSTLFTLINCAGLLALIFTRSAATPG